ncbi:MAG: TAXI family TRAP transporter solute-binding subunit [Chloroflexaceae bacterium]|nr:TAXI family TRAP transporter solute-binding subunit [Chloroflexaceae bacterium]
MEEEAPAAEEAMEEEASAAEEAMEEEAMEEGAAMAAPASLDYSEATRQAFGGGPVGGAFQTFANAMALIMQDNYEYLDIAAEGTGGSGANLRGVNEGDFQYGIVYSGDAFLGLQGALPEDPAIYDQVRPISALYGGVAHLVVTVNSGIESVADLPGKRIALGNAGSGAALSAERYFSSLGILDQVQIEFLGYSQAAQAMGDGQLDGFWVLAAFPNASVTEASTFADIRLIDLYNPGVEGGFFEDYPFYTQRVLLGGVYPSIEEDVMSFQDTAMLVTNADVPEELVFNALAAIYSDEGLAAMREAHPAAEEMNREGGLLGISTPIHPGAMRYWQEVGIEISENIMPE